MSGTLHLVSCETDPKSGPRLVAAVGLSVGLLIAIGAGWVWLTGILDSAIGGVPPMLAASGGLVALFGSLALTNVILRRSRLAAARHRLRFEGERVELRTPSAVHRFENRGVTLLENLGVELRVRLPDGAEVVLPADFEPADFGTALRLWSRGGRYRSLRLDCIDGRLRWLAVGVFNTRRLE